MAPTPRASRFASAMMRFGLVGLTGIGVNQVAFGLLAAFGVHYAAAAVLATQLSTTWNFFGTERWAFVDRRSSGSPWKRFVSFAIVNNSTLLLRIPMLWLLVDVLGLGMLTANLLSLIALFLVRFTISRDMIWSAGEPKASPLSLVTERVSSDTRDERQGDPRLTPVGPRRSAAFGYDIAGIIRVDSDVRMPELAFFLSDSTSHPDIVIRTERVGGWPARRTRFVQDGGRLSYTEHLGMAGANFRITMGDPIVISVAPLLAASRHVLYTNVVEALLRFLLVSKDHALLHSACIVSDGHANLLSAQTDTGKTSTVIQLVREHGYGFLSDDMTIIAPDGRAIAYPKPMTLSYHTMSAMAGQQLTRRQRIALAIQSRLHSKSGRSVGRLLGNLNLPIMSINSIIQILVPPPKYHINSLFDCNVGGSAPVQNVFLMERGEPMREAVGVEESITQLIDNTDDAYGFPPFATFAPHIRIGGEDYEALRQKEVRLLSAALGGTKVWRVRVSGHEWAELLPGLMVGTPDIKDAPDEVFAALAVETDAGDNVLRAEGSSVTNAG